MRIQSSKTGILIVIITVLLSSCGSSRKTSSYTTVQDKLESEFQRYQGTPYRYGGTTKSGFDCSGLVHTVYFNAFKYNLPRTTDEMSKLGHKISKSLLRSDDLVFFKPSRKYMHVGIYMGNNIFMHSSTSQGVIKSKLDNVYWKGKYHFSRRILKLNK